MSKKYNYIGFLADLLYDKNFKYKDYKNIRKILLCKCGGKTELSNEGSRDIWSHYNHNHITCSKCKKVPQKKETILLNSRMRENIVKINYNVFQDGDIIKLVKFEDFVGINLKSKNIFYKTEKSSISFNKKTNRFYYYTSFAKAGKPKGTISIGLGGIHYYADQFLEPFLLNRKCCYNPENKIHVFRNIQKNYIEPYNEFVNFLLQFIDKRDSDRVLKFLHRVSLVDLPTDNDCRLKGDFSGYDRAKMFAVQNLCIQNLQILISLIQYPNLSVLLFNSKNLNYSYLLKQCSPVSYFKSNKPTSQHQILKNIFIGKAKFFIKLIHKEIYNEYHYDFKQSTNYNKNLTFRQIKNLYVKEMIELPEEQDLPFGPPESNDIYSTNLALKFESLECINDYIKFVEKQRFPKFISKTIKKDFYNETLNPIEITYAYFLLIYNEFFDEKEIIKYTQIYGVNKFFNTIYGMFNMVYPYFNGIKLYSKTGIEGEYTSKPILHFLKITKHCNGNGFESYHNSFTIYKDALRMFKSRNQDLNLFYKVKSREELRDLHDHLSQIVQLEKMQEFNKGISEFSKKYQHIKKTTQKGIQFILIDNVDALSEEGNTMRHCVKSYARKMSEGKHLIFSVKDLETEERATLEFSNQTHNEFEEDNWRFNQLKGKFNQKASNKIKDSIKDFSKNVLQKNKIKHKINPQAYDLQLKEDLENFSPINLQPQPQQPQERPVRQVEEDWDNGFWDDDLPF